MQDNIIKFSQQHAPILPVIKVSDPEEIVPLAQALQQGGITALEITLRSDAAMAAIQIAKQEFPEFVISAGTVTQAAQIEKLVALDIDFIVTPGVTKHLLDVAKANQVNILPGVNGSSDVMLGMEYDLHYFKLFPAMVVGGIDMLKSLAGPFSDCYFCPTGGLTANNFLDFYNLPNVFAFGGSWMVADKLVDEKDWPTITKLSQQAVQQLSAS